MPLTVEAKNVGDWLVYDQAPYSRSKRTILAGSSADRVLTNGMVLGKATLGAATPAAVGDLSGKGTIATATVTNLAKPGVYTVEIIKAATNAGDFELRDPDGNVVGLGTVAAAFSKAGLAFTVTDGGTDFEVGDQFTITVAAGSGKFVQIDFAGETGIEDAAGILYDDVTAPDGVDAVGTVVERHAVIDLSQLTWPAGATTPQKATAQAQLEAKGFVFV